MSEPSIMEQVRFFANPESQPVTVYIADIAKALIDAVEVIEGLGSAVTMGGKKDVEERLLDARDFLRKIGAGE